MRRKIRIISLINAIIILLQAVLPICSFGERGDFVRYVNNTTGVQKQPKVPYAWYGSWDETPNVRNNTFTAGNRGKLIGAFSRCTNGQHGESYPEDTDWGENYDSTVTLTSSNQIYLISGGSYRFTYSISGCNESKSSLAIYLKKDGKTDTVYGGDIDRTYTDTNDRKEKDAIDYSITVNQAGWYTVEIRVRRWDIHMNPAETDHDYIDDFVGAFIYNDYAYNPSYTVTYDYRTNGGTGASVTSAEVAAGSPANLGVSATKAEWNFIGWNTNPNATTGLTSFIPTGNTTLYAIYSKTLTGTFIDYQGTTKTTRTQNVTIYNNQTSGTIIAPTGNTYSGWTWRGWSANGVTTANAAVGVANGANITLTANATYYGLYQQNISLTYNSNGGSAVSPSSGIRYFNSNGNYANPSITISNTVPTKTGYEFLNTWNTNINGTGTSYTRGRAYTFSNNTTVYAQWKLITKNITGNVTWNDQANKYSARPGNVTVSLNRTPTTGVVTALPGNISVSGNSAYAFNNVQTYDTTTGKAYNYSVNQNKVTGYRTTINGYNIVNDLIIPTYTSNITYTPQNTYNNLYLKNGKIKVNAVVQNTNSSTYPELGLNNGIVTFNIDKEISLDTSTLKITYTDKNGAKKNITKYTLNNNTLTIDFGENKISKAQEKLEIEVIGIPNAIKEYTSNISLTGNLRSYNGENTSINLGTLTSKQAKFNVENQMPKANIQLTKKDSITEENLNNATFMLYEWNGKEYVEKETLTNNGDGTYTSSYYQWNEQTEGKYKIVETKTPEKHKDLNFSMEYTINQLKQQDYTITPDYDNGAYRIAYALRTPDDFDRINGVIENEPYKVKASIEKIDSQTKRTIQADATFTIYEWDNQKQEYIEYVSKIDNQKVTMVRKEDGSYLSSQWLYYTNQNEGKFRIIETQAPYGYYGDYQNKETKQKNTYDINILDIVQSGIYHGQSVGNESTINIQNNGTKLENTKVTNKIEITKVDSQNKTTSPQGQASIQGAIYELYAKEDIYHPDGTTTNYPGQEGLLYKAGELIDTQETKQDGTLAFENLESGKYYIKEKQASEGYLLDNQEYEIDLTYKNEENQQIVVTKILEEQVKKQAFQILKLNPKEGTEYEELGKAGFSIYQIDKLNIVQEGKIQRVTKDKYKLLDETAIKDDRITQKQQQDGTYKLMDLIDYYYKKDQNEPTSGETYHPYTIGEEALAKDYTNSVEGNIIQELTTRSDGVIISPELAYGEYVVIETSVPVKYETARPFVVSIENDSRTPQNLRYIIDYNFETKVKLYKIDADTKQNVIGKTAKYVIRNLETNQLVTKRTWESEAGYIEQGTYERPYETGNEGYLITPVALGVGKYEIEEVEAPNGYIQNGYESNKKTKVQFEIIGNTAYETDEYLEENIIIQKQENEAQVGHLTITTIGEYLKDVTKDEQGQTKINYEKAQVQGATYQIIASENILSQDGKTLIYEQGKIVETVTTNEEGKAIVENLPLGRYKIKQTKAGEGFALNQEEREINIAYGSNNKELEEGTNEWKQEAQKTPVIYYEETYENQRQKVEIEVTNKDEQTKEPIQGTQIGLYAKEDIVDKSGKVVIKKDQLIEQNTTNEQGQIKTTLDLPLGNYYVKEIKAANGYVENQQQIDINATYQEDGRDVNVIQKEITSNKTSVYIKPVDEQGNIIEGSKLQIVDESGNVIEEWTSSNEIKQIQKLEVGKKYYLKQTEPLKGYATIEEYEFVIKEDGSLQEQVSDEKNTIKPIYYTTKLELHLIDKETLEEIPEIKFEIYKQEKTQDSEGKEVITLGEKIVEFTLGEKGTLIQKLETGNYIIKETKGQEEQIQNKGYVTLEEHNFTIEDTKEVQKITLEQDYTKVEIELIDKENKQKIPGVKFELYKQETIQDEQGNEQKILGEKVREFETGEENYQTIKLPVGSYIIKELGEQKESLSNKGYVTNSDVEIQVQDKKEVQKITLEQEHTKLEVEVVDKETKEKLQGIKFELYPIIEKEDGTITIGEKIREFETSEENYQTTKLPVGSYKLVQLPNQESVINKGYATLEDYEFTITDTKEVQKITLEQEHTKLEVEIVNKETKEKLQGIKFELYPIIEKEDGTITIGEKIREFETGEENYQTTKLPIGSYKLVQLPNQESVVNKGYATLEDYEFTITDKKEVQKITLEQEYTKLEIHLIDKETLEEMPEIKFEIYKQEKTQDNEGKEVITLGEKVVEFTKGEKGTLIQKLETGNYIIKEAKGQEEQIQGKGYVTLEDYKFTVQDTKEVQKVILEQEYTKLEVEVVDKETKEKMPGVKFEIYKQDIIQDEQGNEQKVLGEKIREFETGEENYQTTKLPIGNYILVQLQNQKNITNKGYTTLENYEFVVADTKEVQKVALEQDYTKLEVEVVDKETKEKIPGIKFELYKQETIQDEQGNEQKILGEKIKEFETNEENYQTIKLPIGSYKLVQLPNQESVINKGYITLEDYEFTITDTKEVQKITLEQDYTKLKVNLLDKETLEAVIGGTLRITDKEGKEVIEPWISEETEKIITRIPVGEYYLEETNAPTLKGYVKTEKILFKVEEIGSIQQAEMLQDYTKIQIKPEDEVTKEEIKDIELVIKDEQGNEVGKITIGEEQEEEILTKLPVGTYTLESTKTPYGYKEIKTEIKIDDKQEIQIYDTKVEREEFDLSIDTWIKEITRNGEVEYENRKEEKNIKKVDIKDKKIGTEEIQVKYKIKIANPGKITGQVGKVEVSIPQGMKYVAEDNEKYWEEENGKVVTRGLEGRDIKSGYYAEIELVLRWKNGLENFGTKELEVEIQETKSDIGFEETNKENNKAKAPGVIIGVSTGEMNLVYTCWILLGILILLEIIISRKTKVKQFKIKDKTLKYRK